MTSATAVRDQPVTRDEVVDTALRLIEENDISALTMRRLAAELGTAVTSIYWHVGNRDALLDLLVERLISDLGNVRYAGRTPRARITSLARQWRLRLWEHPHLIAIAHERGRIAAMFAPMQQALAGELAQVGVTGTKAATAIGALQFHIAASVVMERTASRGPSAMVGDPAAWPASYGDPALVAALSAPVDYPAVFDLGLSALLDRLVP
ncbi:MAG TPA: TetR family transcriptional regulator [Mycobacteriales bacterium]|nr:TetR family transcriptional regulator [Mycobacteriales bacterium]